MLETFQLGFNFKSINQQVEFNKPNNMSNDLDPR